MTKVNTVRKIDLEYLDQNFFKNPKQIHLKARQLILQSLNVKKNQKIKLVDFGSADGQFLNVMNKKSKFNFSLEGVEPVEKLIKFAKKKLKNVYFQKGSILDKNLYKNSSLDVGISIGLLCLLKDHKRYLNNLLHWVKPGGIILVCSIFNNENFDVSIDYKESTQESFNKLNAKSGWNIFSKKTLADYLKNSGVKEFKFIDFNMKKKIDYNKEKPLKLWTKRLKNNQLICINGLSIILDQKFLLIKR
tara:strand:+ start:220 stop:960 length:741 start_codon:yes stop_codon:yes gene_type:complete